MRWNPSKRTIGFLAAFFIAYGGIRTAVEFAAEDVKLTATYLPGWTQALVNGLLSPWFYRPAFIVSAIALLVLFFQSRDSSISPPTPLTPDAASLNDPDPSTPPPAPIELEIGVHEEWPRIGDSIDNGVLVFQLRLRINNKSREAKQVTDIRVEAPDKLSLNDERLRNEVDQLRQKHPPDNLPILISAGGTIFTWFTETFVYMPSGTRPAYTVVVVDEKGQEYPYSKDLRNEPKAEQKVEETVQASNRQRALRLARQIDAWLKGPDIKRWPPKGSVKGDPTYLMNEAQNSLVRREFEEKFLHRLRTLHGILARQGPLDPILESMYNGPETFADAQLLVERLRKLAMQPEDDGLAAEASEKQPTISRDVLREELADTSHRILKWTEKEAQIMVSMGHAGGFRLRFEATVVDRFSQEFGAQVAWLLDECQKEGLDMSELHEVLRQMTGIQAVRALAIRLGALARRLR